MADSPAQLRNLDQLLYDNVGGIEALWYADVADVLSYPETDAAALVNSVQLVAGATWYQLVASRQSLGFSQPGKYDRHGDYWQPSLKGALAKGSAALAQGLEALDGRRLLVIYRDMNGLVWLVGSPDEPLRFSEKYDAGTVTARNNYDFTFSGETTRRARPYLGSWTVSGRGLESGVQLGSGPASGTVELRTAGGRLLALVPAGKTVVLKSDFKLKYEIVG
jgi:hypothetical protein